MLLDKEQLYEAVRITIRNRNTQDLSRQRELDIALELCLDKVSNALRSSSHVTSGTGSVSAGDREFTMSDIDSALRYLWALKIVIGSTTKVLEYQDPDTFLRDFEEVSRTAGVPEYFTILTTSAGSPVVRFDKPCSAAGTLTAYYHPELVPENVHQLRGGAVLVAGTLAEFYNGTPFGDAKAVEFADGLKSLRAGNEFMAKGVITFRRAEVDRTINTLRKSMQARRR